MRDFNSSRRRFTFASSSAAETTTLNSRLRPSDNVSVTCIDQHTFLLAAFGSGLFPCQATCCVSLTPLVWCGRRDSNPHDFRHGNLNPARLPIPPRPQRAISRTILVPQFRQGLTQRGPLGQAFWPPFRPRLIT